MADNSTEGQWAQEVIASYSPYLISNYITLSAAVLVFYDHILTFPVEKSKIWRGNFNIAKALSVLYRYPALIYQASSVFLYFYRPASNIECRVLNYVNEVSASIVSVAFCSMFILLAFAIYGKSRIIVFILSIPALLFVASEIWLTADETALALPLELQIDSMTCYFIDESSVSTSYLINTVSALFYHVLVALLIVYRAAKLLKDCRKANIVVKSSPSFMLLRNAIIYSLTILLPLIASYALSQVVLSSSNTNATYAADNLDCVVNALQVIIANRLFIDFSKSGNVRKYSEIRPRMVTHRTFASNQVLRRSDASALNFLEHYDNVESEIDVFEERSISVKESSRRGSENFGMQVMHIRVDRYMAQDTSRLSTIVQENGDIPTLGGP